MKSVNRREFVKGGVAAAAAAAVVPTLAVAEEAAPAPSLTPSGLPLGIEPEDLQYSCVELEPITEFAAEETYDIVVVGAGVSGCPAILTAVEEGATVGCLQKAAAVAANGNGTSAVVKGHSTPGGIARFRADWMKANSWRVNPALFDYYIDHSEETLSWAVQRGIDEGVVPSFTIKDAIAYPDGELLADFSAGFPTQQKLQTALAARAMDLGAVIHFSTPCVQLVQDETGRVTGAIGKAEDGTYIKMNANKAVILCAGDYMNNPALLNRYCADVATCDFDLRQANRTGDGHILASLAGGRIVAAGHAKQIHDLSVSKYTMMGVPFLMLDKNGERFFNEECTMSEWCTPIKYRYPNEKPRMYRIFDSAFEQKYAGCDIMTTCAFLDSNLLAPERYGSKGIYKADTIEELCEIWGVDAAPFLASIERYNDLCAKGIDEDFGKDPKYMCAIDTPPYYGLLYSPGLAAINGGVYVDEHYQVVDADRNPIPGLFAAGVDAGDLCGGNNWTMPGGCSNTHCINAGRYTVIYALTGAMEPSNPCTVEQIAEYLKDEDGKYLWETYDNCYHAIPRW